MAKAGFKLGSSDLSAFIQWGHFIFLIWWWRLSPRKASSQLIEGRIRTEIRTPASQLHSVPQLMACLMFLMTRGLWLYLAPHPVPKGDCTPPQPGILIFSLICSPRSRESLAAPWERADIWLTAGLSMATATLWCRMWALCVFIFLFSADIRTG